MILVFIFTLAIGFILGYIYFVFYNQNHQLKRLKAIEDNIHERERINFELHNHITDQRSEIWDLTDKARKLQNILTAATEAQLRAREEKDSKGFHSLPINGKEKADIISIKEIENKLNNPRPVRMLIWSTFYQKKAQELCAKILGKDKVCGIYKITNLKDNYCYIGQSKDVSDRWKEHMKCGLGIDAPAGNKLYAAMMEDGLESFTFELLEACPAEDLNEKEKTYILLYNSFNIGYNSNSGIGEGLL